MGYDLAMPAEKPGVCPKCKGSGLYRWGASINGRSANQGTCFSCQGTGKQTKRDIIRNQTYNRYKIVEICRGECA